MNLIEALSVFGISSISEENHISLKQKYRKLAKEKHPDRTGGGSDDFVALQEAYILLKKDLKHSPKESVNEGEVNNFEQSFTPQSSSKSKGYVVVDQADIEKMEQEKANSVSESTELKTLSKDELLEKYYHDTQSLKEKLGDLISNHELHRNVLQVVETEVSLLSEDYRTEMNQLQTRYQKEIEKLEKNTFYRVWIRYFVSPLTGKDIWARYRENVETYEEERQKVKSSFNERLLGIYGESLNEMSKYLTSSNK